MRTLKKTALAVFPTAALLSLVLSCDKAVSPAVPAEEEPGRDVEMCDLSVSVRLSRTATKVASQSETNEKTIQNIQLWVFHAGDAANSGTLDITASYGFDSPMGETGGTFCDPANDLLRIKCATGPHRIYAIVNDAVDRTKDLGITTENDFLNLSVELKDNAPDRLFMYGHTDKELVFGEDMVSVTVDRMVAAIVLESVRNDFYSSSYQAPGIFRVCDSYLINVPARNTFRGNLDPLTLDPSFWYGKQGAEQSEQLRGLIYDKVTPQVVNYGEADDVTHTFYSFANSCALNRNETWEPRATLLVVEAEINYNGSWIKYYYPVALTGTESAPGIAANTKYAVNLIVHRPGSLDPNVPVTFFECTPEITVSPWNEGDPYNPEI